MGGISCQRAIQSGMAGDAIKINGAALTATVEIVSQNNQLSSASMAAIARRRRRASANSARPNQFRNKRARPAASPIVIARHRE